MAMPYHLMLVRHGESEGNVATAAAREGDDSWYTDAFLTTPGHRWRLTDVGRAQAVAVGGWLAQELPEFDVFYVSPYVRARETAAHLGLRGARWRINRALRERDWGDIGSVPLSEFRSRPEYELNAVSRATDPLYWRAPNGESIAEVAEDRVRNVLSALHREPDGVSVVAVTHGETMTAFRLVIERADDEQYAAWDADRAEHLRNGEVLHYSRVDPATGTVEASLRWVRRAHPSETPDGWQVEAGPWRRFDFGTHDNAALLAAVEAVPSLRPDPPA